MMQLVWVVSRVFEVVGALRVGEGAKKLADGCADGFDCSCGRFAQQMLKLGKDLFDGVQVGRVFCRKNNFAPAERISCRTILPLWLPRLSMMTMSPGRSVGRRTFST